MNAGMGGGGAVEAGLRWVEEHIDDAGWAARSGRTHPLPLSLDRMRRFATILGEPQKGLSIVHVSGTNGKGSTSRMITRLLMAEGLRVGTYSSPHLARYNERFRIDDEDIDDDSLAALLHDMAAGEEHLGDRLRPFEILTGAAYAWFAAEQVDVAVVEVGVLGRFDATNVGHARVAVITNVGFDHTSGQGDWRLRIAREKAGIVEPGAAVVLGPMEERLRAVFAVERPTTLWQLGREIVLRADMATDTGRRISVDTPVQSSDAVAVPLRGRHQSANAALAIAAAQAHLGRPLDPSRLAAGLAAVRMPGRLECIRTGAPDGGPVVVLDGAHNPDAARALAAALRDDVILTGRRTLVIGLLAGRDPMVMLDAVDAGTFDDIVACTPPTARGSSAEELVSAARIRGWSARAIPSVADALQHTTTTAAAGDQIVVTGSIYLVAEARSWLDGER